jgi:hypothetical protein
MREEGRMPVSATAASTSAKRSGTPSRVGFTRSQRVVIALLIGLVAGLVSFNQITDTNRARGVWRWGQDFTYPWRGAQALRVGVNPYEAIQPVAGTKFPFTNVLAYPLTAVLVATPFANVHADVAAAIFEGLGFALAAYGLLGLATWRLLALVSAPAAWAISNAQWAPLLIGATLVPRFGGLLACKPTLGAALFLWRPDRRIFWGAAALVGVCFLLQPTWLVDWIEVNRHNPDLRRYVPPIRMFGGPILLLALLRWRRAEARLLFLLACVPQNVFFSDQLTLLLIPHTAVEMIASVAWTHIVERLAIAAHPPNGAYVVTKVWTPYILWGLYVPALLLVLRRKNEGAIPSWLDRRIASWPPWMRGRQTKALPDATSPASVS